MDLSGKRDAAPPVPPSISVLRSVRAGETQNPATPPVPARAGDAATACGRAQRTMGQTELRARRRNVRRHFRKVAEAAGLAAGEWTRRELRHSFVSLLSDDGMPIERIARLVGHISTAVTETGYRQQIRPVIVEGAEAMDRIFRENASAPEGVVTQRPVP